MYRQSTGVCACTVDGDIQWAGYFSRQQGPRRRMHRGKTRHESIQKQLKTPSTHPHNNFQPCRGVPAAAVGRTGERERAQTTERAVQSDANSTLNKYVQYNLRERSMMFFLASTTTVLTPALRFAFPLRGL